MTERMFRRIIARALGDAHGQARASPSTPGDCTISPMKEYESRIRELSGIEQNEHPRLVCETITDDGRVVAAFYETEEAGYDGEIIVIEERDMAEVRR